MPSSSYRTLYAFGDSLSDAGNVSIATTLVGSIPVSPPYYAQSYGLLTAAVFSNGPVWVQDLSQSLGLGTLAPSLAGGNDFAYGGAQAIANTSTLSGLGQSVTSLASQLAQYQAGPGDSAAGALYTVSIGTNDIVTILEETGADLAKMQGQVAEAVSSEMSFLTSLANSGASSMLVLDVPDMSKMPVVTKQNDASKDALAGQLSNLYNIELNAQLENLAQARGISLSILPLYSLTDEAVASPSTFQLSNATDPAWTGSLTDPHSGTVAASPNTYLFWDQYHPTAHVQQLIANDAQSLLTTGTQLFSAPTVQMTDVAAGLNSVQYGSVLAAPQASLQSEFLYPGADSVAVRANTGSVFLHGGSADDALQATSGTNVLDGGAGSSFLVGATGADGGADAFFSNSAGGTGWDTVVNFHPGDSATLWGYVAGVSAWSWDGTAGAAGYTGATLRADIAGSGGVDRSITFAGLSMAQVQSLQVTTGTVGGTPYLLLQDQTV